MNAILFDLGAAPGVAESLTDRLGCARGQIELRQFPDGESYLRLLTSVAGSDVILLCTLDRPDPKVLPLLFAAAAARDQGAASVGLVAPYLSYMRQDKAFSPGEAVTSAAFAELVSKHFDWLVTVDPHLHRYPGLDAIYSVPADAASAADAIGDWLRVAVPNPIVIGPDEESRQWAERIAKVASAPVTLLRKTRSGDRSVEIEPTAMAHLAAGTPVIVDDIASTACTMIEAVGLLRREGQSNPVCAIVHPIFAGNSYDELIAAGAARVVSTNTIDHASNVIDVSRAIAEPIGKMLASNGMSQD